MRMRAALAKSKNLVTVRVLQAIGPQYAQDYITRFGFDPKLHPPYLTMGARRRLGDAAADGERVRRVRQRRLSRRALPHRARSPTPRATCCPKPSRSSAARTPSARSTRATRWIMTSLLQRRRRVRAPRRARMSLGRKDLAGKTGTTNENVDAWFCGFNASIVGVAWIGFDQPQDARRQRDRRRSPRCRSGSATCRRR